MAANYKTPPPENYKSVRFGEDFRTLWRPADEEVEPLVMMSPWWWAARVLLVGMPWMVGIPCYLFAWLFPRYDFRLLRYARSAANVAFCLQVFIAVGARYLLHWMTIEGSYFSLSYSWILWVLWETDITYLVCLWMMLKFGRVVSEENERGQRYLRWAKRGLRYLILIRVAWSSRSFIKPLLYGLEYYSLLGMMVVRRLWTGVKGEYATCWACRKIVQVEAWFTDGKTPGDIW
jgi:hypothetical protein